MNPAAKKFLIFAGVCGLWLGGDLWTKHWADVSLADSGHPLPVHVTEAEAGQPLASVLAAHFGVDAEAGAALARRTRRLAPAVALTPDAPAFGPTSPVAGTTAFYAFWRGPDRAPRLVSLDQRQRLMTWLRLAAPKAAPERVSGAVEEHFSSLTLGEWLAQEIRGLSKGDVPAVLASGMHALDRAQRPGPDTVTAAGETWLVEDRVVEVMGQWSVDESGRRVRPWFNFLYAENTGAAFGFMKGLPVDLRFALFIGLTIVAFGVILVITHRMPNGAWWIHTGLAAIFAGAAGNFIDRIRYGYVIDFIDMHLGFMHWPTYNVADIAIAVGVILLIGDMLFNKNSPLVRDEKAAAAGASDEQTAPASV